MIAVCTVFLLFFPLAVTMPKDGVTEIGQSWFELYGSQENPEEIVFQRLQFSAEGA